MALLGDTSAPKIGVFDIATETIQTGFGDSGYFNLPQVWTAHPKEFEEVAVKREKLDYGIRKKRHDLSVRS